MAQDESGSFRQAKCDSTVRDNGMYASGPREIKSASRPTRGLGRFRRKGMEGATRVRIPAMMHNSPMIATEATTENTYALWYDESEHSDAKMSPMLTLTKSNVRRSRLAESGQDSGDLAMRTMICMAVIDMGMVAGRPRERGPNSAIRSAAFPDRHMKNTRANKRTAAITATNEYRSDA